MQFCIQCTKSTQKQYSSSIQTVPRLVIQDVYKEYPSSSSSVQGVTKQQFQCTRSGQAVALVYNKWPSSSSSVQGVTKQQLQCTRSGQGVALVYKECPNLYTCCAQIGLWLGHVYISKQFPNLGTPSVTAWRQLVHMSTCKSVSKLGTPTFTAVLESVSHVPSNPANRVSFWIGYEQPQGSVFSCSQCFNTDSNMSIVLQGNGLPS